MITVTHFLRRPVVGAYSVERYFEDIRQYLSYKINFRIVVNKNKSTGILPRLKDAFHASFSQSDVNHITGDVHYLVYFLKRRCTILTILDCISLNRSSGVRFWILWFFWFWLPEKRCSKITVISEATRQDLLKYLRCDPAKIQVIYCNVSDEFQPDPQPFRSSCPRILHIGTKSNKNLERHAAALAGINCHLMVIGILSENQKKILEVHNIQYTNHVGLSREELVAAYRDCDLLLFSSTFEGFGLPIIEAQAIGRPVITSDLLSMPEVAGNAACLVDPYNVDSIRDGIQKVLGNADYRHFLIELGFENVKRFRIEVIADQYAKLYHEIRICF